MSILKFQTKEFLKHPQLKEAVGAMLESLSIKDPQTCAHSVRVSEYALMMAQALKLSPEEALKLELGALLHDVGKIGVPDAILLKEGKLTPEEFEIMKKHSVWSAKIISQLSHMADIIPIVKHHHERIDGLGYPEGLKDREIPYLTKIVFIVDAFDAMTSDRPYRKALPTHQAYEELSRCAGTQFDTRLVQVFIEAHKKKKYQFVKSNFYTPPIKHKKAVGA
ncbi:MAG: hypothetical protein A3B70_07905 [Deltaproteobacteria bacterium RIFCSPHIGHO2_02_FULL_40_11]|nr:MAG: hypothetical protein A3B70_07905 [Deltaproteobacteria bacterium RIFCSPHIGHO2_02_FULL_40_11]